MDYFQRYFDDEKNNNRADEQFISWWLDDNVCITQNQNDYVSIYDMTTLIQHEYSLQFTVEIILLDIINKRWPNLFNAIFTINDISMNNILTNAKIKNISNGCRLETIRIKFNYDNLDFSKNNSYDEIIPGLFLGSENATYELTSVKQINPFIIAMGSEQLQHSTVNCFFRINDKIDANIIKFFHVINCQITTKLEKKIPVLVHCRMGVSRSAACILAYLMWSKGMSLEDAFTFVNKKRRIRPNVGFLHQLFLYFEKELI